MAELSRNLAVSLRPRRFSEVVGYSAIIDQIRKQYTSGRIPTAMGFVGMSRGGKTTLARIIAAAVNCDHSETFGEPCDICLLRCEDKTYDVFERNAALLNKVEDARDLVSGLSFVPQYGKYRVFILDECQMMTKEAQNVMLKALEEEETSNIFLFCTTDPEKIIPALRKRWGASYFTLQGLTQPEIKQLMWRAALAIKPEAEWASQKAELAQLFKLVIEREIEAPGDIVSAVESLSIGKTAEASAVSSEFSGKVDIWKLINSMHNGDWNGCREQLVLAEARDGAELAVKIAFDLRRKMLAENVSPNRLSQLSGWIHQLVQSETYVAGIMLSSVTAVIWNVCESVKSRVQTIRTAEAA